MTIDNIKIDGKNIFTIDRKTLAQINGEAIKIIEDLRLKGLNDKDIMHAMCDGEYLERENISQVLAETIFTKVKKCKLLYFYLKSNVACDILFLQKN